MPSTDATMPDNTRAPEGLGAGIQAEVDLVNHPPHYRGHPSGIEVIQITRHMGFNLGNVVKYVLRCDLKKNAIQDLEKAVWYLQDEIAKRKAAEAAQQF